MEDVRALETTWINHATGHSLFYRWYEPSISDGLLVIVHGFGEHGGRYGILAHALARQRLTVACPDLWGHGRSGGPRGDVEVFERYLDDLDALTQDVFTARAGKRRYAVFGHSFGGLAAIHWALRSPAPLRCLMIQSPLLAVGYRVPAWKVYFAQGVGMVAGRLSLSTELDASSLSRDPMVAKRYREDPLVHGRISLRGYLGLEKAMQRAREQAALVTAPTLALLGTADRVVSVDAGRTWYSNLRCEKRLEAFEGCYHELHHEPVYSQVVEQIVEWSRAHA